ncbi:AAA family ATPase [Bosea sp. 2KB_26]|uniref:AAA family ATPase n=1 Tax=Bosea sp. 2KB_26 TaxID=3237475 RepID=UPI003F903675
MPSSEQDFFVITGGPGSGKSTLLDRLEKNGVPRSAEAGRGIIQDQLAIGGSALPWMDRELFAELMLSWEMRSHRQATQQHAIGRMLFDRGLPDIIGYLQVEGLSVPDHVRQASERLRYNTCVFIAPPWPEIYRQDAERKQDLDTAHRTYEAMIAVYTALGYDLVELPRTSIEDRAEFVRSLIG